MGGLGQDVLRGGNGNDILIGDVDVRGGRTDTLNNDTMEGGAGNDTYYVNSAADGVVEAVGQGMDNVILTSAFASTAYTLADNVENLSVLGTNAVSLTGNALANTITGNAANNSLVGGAGNDTLTGGAGADQFAYITLRAFSTSDVGQDTITDFVQGTDRITLSRQTFGLSSTVGNGLSVASEFASVNDAASAEISAALVVFNRANNSLIYNQNGAAAGFGTGGAFATTTNVATIASSDFTIVV
ncbi:calcium-binding protein [Phormidium tenue FACHB-886]|nr:calcium-binding protein [Phormidium tenue FACHB-886]